MSATHACLAIAPQEAMVARMIRVDHAGEYGAARIYAGQLAVLRRSDAAPVLREMQAQEHQHLDRFADLIVPPPRASDGDAAAVACGRLRARCGDRGAGRTRGDGLYRGGGGSDRRALRRADRRTRRQRGRTARHAGKVPRGGAAASRHRAAAWRGAGARLSAAVGGDQGRLPGRDPHQRTRVREGTQPTIHGPDRADSRSVASTSRSCARATGRRSCCCTACTRGPAGAVPRSARGARPRSSRRRIPASAIRRGRPTSTPSMTSCISISTCWRRCRTRR